MTTTTFPHITQTFRQRYEEWEESELYMSKVYENLEYDALSMFLEGSKEKQELFIAHITSDMFSDKTIRAIYEWALRYAKQFPNKRLDCYNLVMSSDDPKEIFYTQYLLGNDGNGGLKGWFVTDKTLPNYIILLHLAFKKRMQAECRTLEDFKALEEKLEKYELKDVQENSLLAISENYLLNYENANESLVETGYRSIDELIGGLYGGNLMLLAGATGMGKTCMMLNILIRMAKRCKKVLLFSLEMTPTEVINRIIAIDTGINSANIRNHTMTDTEFEKFVKYTNGIRWQELNNQITVLSGNYTVEDIASVVKNSKADVVFIDYLGLIASTDRNKSKYESVSEISRRLKVLANESNKPFIVLHQLNRDVKNRADKRPTLSDIRDSGQIEQDADFISFVFRPAYYDTAEPKENLKFILGKSRHTSVGERQLLYNGTTQKIDDVLQSAGIGRAAKGKQQALVPIAKQLNLI